MKQALGLDGITYEGDVAELGDKAIEAAVYALDKTGTKKTAEAVTLPANTATANA